MAAQLVPLSRQKVAEASRSLAAAFFDDPTSRFLLPHEESRDRWLRLIHQAGLRHVLPEGHVYAVSGDEVTGVIGLGPPRRYPPSRSRLPPPPHPDHPAAAPGRLPAGTRSAGGPDAGVDRPAAHQGATLVRSGAGGAPGAAGGGAGARPS